MFGGNELRAQPRHRSQMQASGLFAYHIATDEWECLRYEHFRTEPWVLESCCHGGASLCLLSRRLHVTSRCLRLCCGSSERRSLAFAHAVLCRDDGAFNPVESDDRLMGRAGHTMVYSKREHCLFVVGGQRNNTVREPKSQASCSAPFCWPHHWLALLVTVAWHCLIACHC